jgi:nucleoporin NDC1
LILALSHLVAASLKDDTLGNVQRDIPRVLEALLSFLAETEAFEAELESKLPQQRQQGDGANDNRLEDVETARDVARAIEAVVPVLNGVFTFGMPC